MNMYIYKQKNTFKIINEKNLVITFYQKIILMFNFKDKKENIYS